MILVVLGGVKFLLGLPDLLFVVKICLLWEGGVHQLLLLELIDFVDCVFKYFFHFPVLFLP